jgi:protein-tyrosine kinase
VGRAYGLPILASIPRARNIWKESRKSGQSSPEREAFGMLRANLRYLGVNSDIRSLLVTSAGRGDGKSAVAWNLALAEAKAGRDVLLIEADLRAGHLAERLHLMRNTGLSLLLAGGASLEETTVTAMTSSGRLDVVPAGPPATNPGELGESPQMALLLETAQMRYDLVVVDTPPVSVVADAVPLMGQVGGVILVARLEQSTSDRAEELRNHLRRLGVRVLGVVVNGARPSR